MKPLFLIALLLSSCTREAWHPPLAPDTTALLPALPPGKYKFTGPVNITLQRGTGNVATPTATGKVRAEAAVTSKPGLSYWWLLLVAAIIAYWQRKRLLRLLGCSKLVKVINL